MLSSSSSSNWGRARRSTRLSSSSSSSAGADFDLLLLLEGGAGGLLADLVLAAFLGARHLLGGRALGEHGVEIEDLAELHLAGVQGVRPVDDGVEGDRAFAQAPDHRVAAGLDPLGDGDLALAAEQLDRAHLAKIHPDGIVGAVDRLLLLLDDEALAVRAVVLAGGGVDLGLLRFLLVVVGFLRFHHIDPHFIEGRHDVFDLLGGHLVLRQGFVELVIGDVAALLGAGDELLERGLVEVDQRRIASFLLVFAVTAVGRLRHLKTL